MPIIIEDLKFVYSPKSPFEKLALNNINLTINDGEFFGIIGHTGSGKSTLVSHLNALTKIQSGKIRVDDFDLSKKKFDYKKLRAHIGLVFQYPEYQLFDETVAKDIAFGPKNLKLATEEIDKRVRHSMALVGLDYEKHANRSPFELSGGQKRRVAVAGVLAMEPKILVLDEPTAGLDPKGKQEVLNLISSIKKEMNLTVVMISHNMDEIAKMCDRVAVMANGELKCVLEPSKLFSQKSLLKELNISMPSVTILANELADKGIKVNRDILDEDTLVYQIAQHFKNTSKVNTHTIKNLSNNNDSNESTENSIEINRRDN